MNEPFTVDGRPSRSGLERIADEAAAGVNRFLGEGSYLGAMGSCNAIAPTVSNAAWVSVGTPFPSQEVITLGAASGGVQVYAWPATTYQYFDGALTPINPQPVAWLLWKPGGFPPILPVLLSPIDTDNNNNPVYYAEESITVNVSPYVAGGPYLAGAYIVQTSIPDVNGWTGSITVDPSYGPTLNYSGASYGWQYGPKITISSQNSLDPSQSNDLCCAVYFASAFPIVGNNSLLPVQGFTLYQNGTTSANRDALPVFGIVLGRNVQNLAAGKYLGVYSDFSFTDPLTGTRFIITTSGGIVTGITTAPGSAGAAGTFTTADVPAKTVTVTGGIITSIV